MATTLDVEKLFVSKIIQSGDFNEVASIPSYLIHNPVYEKAFEYIREYVTNFGEVPSYRIFKADNPNTEIVKTDEPWDDLKQRLWNQYRTGMLNSRMDEYVSAMDAGDIERAIRLLSTAVADAHTDLPSSRDVDVTSNGEDRLARYQERRDNPGTLVGIPTGFPTIDRATQGLQQGQLVTFTGLAKASKSTLAMICAMAIQAAGKRVLYLTYEQTVEEQERRLDAYRAGFNDNLLNSGMYTDEQAEALKRAVLLTESMAPMLISEDCLTVGEIAAKIDQFKPDVVIVDGVYMMEDERGETKGSAQCLANIVSGLKFLAMRRSICIVAVTQSTPARTKGETLNNDSIMGSRAFIQFSNTVIGIERTEDTMRRKMRILLSRSCAPVDIMLLFDYDTGNFVEWEDYDMDEDLESELDDQETVSKY